MATTRKITPKHKSQLAPESRPKSPLKVDVTWEDDKPTTLGETPKSMLQQADDLINGQRQKDYGDKLRNFTQIAMGMQMVLAAKLLPGAIITANDVALLMIQVKIARLAKSPDHKDSQIDVAGYIGCMDKLQNEPIGQEDALDQAIINSAGA